MRENKTSRQPIVSSNDYTIAYYLEAMDGHEHYENSELCERLEAVWSISQISEGMQILDIGCGRSEFLVKAALEGAHAFGIDYSTDAMKLTKELLEKQKQYPSKNNSSHVEIHFCLSDATKLPFADQTMDRVIFSDVVEHLYPEQLLMALKEAKRVLKTKGAVVIHTMPNLWYYRYGYLVYRFLMNLRGCHLPRNPRERILWSHVHVNEQTPHSLRKHLKNAGFEHASVWLQDYRSYQDDTSFIRKLKKALTSYPLLKCIFCDDIFAYASKESKKGSSE